ncbi:hypothetical protein [Glaciibacter sp. 2TAF33]|uniref:hypothetical protein n=1 Tax=Glaciibacter sp. 2TAF33 TaxID=3233015 RepID=UPI003F918169
MKVRKSIYTTVGGVILGSLVLAGCSASPTPEPLASSSGDGLEKMEPIVLTYSDSNVDTAAHALAMQNFMDTVTERTKGKVTFETFWSASLHPALEGLSAIESGLTDMTYITTTALPQQLPITAWQATVSQGVVPSEFPTSLLAGSPAQLADYETGPIADELAQYDAATLLAWDTVPYPMLCKPEVKAASDLAGLTVRSPGVTWTKELEGLGMTTTSIPLVDVYEGLQRGIVHCHLGTTSTMITLGMWDEAKYYVPAGLATSAGSVVVIKKSVLESLPKAVQDIIFDARVDLMAETVERSLARDIEFAKQSAEHGIKWVDPKTFQKSIVATRDAYVAEAIKDAPPSLADAKGAYDHLGKLMEKWQETTTDFKYDAGSPSSADGWKDLYLSAADIDWNAYREAIRSYFDALKIS